AELKIAQVGDLLIEAVLMNTHLELGSEAAIFHRKLVAPKVKLPLIRAQDARQNLKSGRLSRPVGAEQPEDLPGPHRKRQPIERDPGAEPTAEALHPKDPLLRANP